MELWMIKVAIREDTVSQNIVEEDYNRVVESVPKILDVDPAKYLKDIIAMAYEIGFKDGMEKSDEIVKECFAKASR